MILNNFALIAQIVTAAALIFAVFQIVGDRTQRLREFENLYVQRYWQILDAMSPPLYEEGILSGESPSDRRACLSYLRLCEDELDLRRAGSITDKTWSIWSEGIRLQMEMTAYADLLSESKPQDLAELKEFLTEYNDPLSWSWLKKWWSGLI